MHNYWCTIEINVCNCKLYVYWNHTFLHNPGGIWLNIYILDYKINVDVYIIIASKYNQNTL